MIFQGRVHLVITYKRGVPSKKNRKEGEKREKKEGMNNQSISENQVNLRD